MPIGARFREVVSDDLYKGINYLQLDRIYVYHNEIGANKYVLRAVLIDPET